MTNLYLIRHGQADGLKLDINGTVVPNVSLSPTGVKQAEHLRDRLIRTEEICADILLSSPLHRARETAQIIAPALGLPVMIDDDFQEINFGLLQSNLLLPFLRSYPNQPAPQPL